MKLTIIGDKELWVAGSDTWSLPIYVTPCADEETKTHFCFIVAALVPTPSQQEALHEHFRKHSIEQAKDRWVISASLISTLATHVDGVTPQFYLSWPAQDGFVEVGPSDEPEFFEVDVKESARPSKDADDFVKLLFQETGMANIDEFRGIWAQLQILGADWIYKHQRTLDLGFVKLDALPYRANWKQIFLARYPWIARWFRLSREERNARLEVHNSAGWIRNSIMAELQPKEWFAHWTVEARPTKAWRKYIEGNERARRSRYSNYSYAVWWRSQINKLEGKIYDILGEFILGTASPCGGFSSGDIQGRRGLTPCVPKGRVLPEGESDSGSVVVSPDPTLEVEDIGEPGEVTFPTEPLQHSLPVIRLPVEDMRHSG